MLACFRFFPSGVVDVMVEVLTRPVEVSKVASRLEASAAIADRLDAEAEVGCKKCGGSTGIKLCRFARLAGGVSDRLGVPTALAVRRTADVLALAAGLMSLSDGSTYPMSRFFGG